MFARILLEFQYQNTLVQLIIYLWKIFEFFNHITILNNMVSIIITVSNKKKKSFLHIDLREYVMLRYEISLQQILSIRDIYFNCDMTVYFIFYSKFLKSVCCVLVLNWIFKFTSIFWFTFYSSNISQSVNNTDDCVM